MKRSPFDPRTHLVLALVLMAMMVAFNHWLLLLGGLGLLVVLVLSLRLFRSWRNFLRHLGIAVLTFFFIAWVAFDLETGIVSGLRLLTIGTVSFLFFQTTPPEIIANGLIKLGCPYAVAFVLNASLQFVPILARRARTIRDAQRSRGIPVEGGVRSLFHLPALAGPLLIQSFKFADELAEAMEARGFGLQGRTFRYALKMRWLDWVLITFSLLVLGLVFLIRFQMLPAF